MQNAEPLPDFLTDQTMAVWGAKQARCAAAIAALDGDPRQAMARSIIKSAMALLADLDNGRIEVEQQRHQKLTERLTAHARAGGEPLPIAQANREVYMELRPIVAREVDSIGIGWQLIGVIAPEASAQ